MKLFDYTFRSADQISFWSSYAPGEDDRLFLRPDQMRPGNMIVNAPPNHDRTTIGIIIAVKPEPDQRHTHLCILWVPSCRS